MGKSTPVPRKFLGKPGSHDFNATETTQMATGPTWPGGGGGDLDKKLSSQLAHISVWNGAFKIAKSCGCVWV